MMTEVYTHPEASGSAEGRRGLQCIQAPRCLNITGAQRDARIAVRNQQPRGTVRPALAADGSRTERNVCRACRFEI
jgi:hypothetical protein